ncbi:hypothetical protein RFI_17442 [Reticulomyxa filosa]|uniref:PXA domain-containing protein n=1 Tax=Reticulomyxa filosa TaxID=46433 RepID=X6N216_RETFI|nr:hypothetical protein RFI_17442 [Reticulomyxa filosa]|eukprot:ETO19789.1 hypothetical protein RFI_17442 [Reticulomyxa filosa]
MKTHLLFFQVLDWLPIKKKNNNNMSILKQCPLTGSNEMKGSMESYIDTNSNVDVNNNGNDTKPNNNSNMNNNGNATMNTNTESKNSEIFVREKYLKPTSNECKALRKHNPKSFKSLQVLRNWIMRDFIEYWYKPFVTSVEEEFVYRIKLALDGAFHILVHRVGHVNWSLYCLSHVMLPFQHFFAKYVRTLDQLMQTNPNFSKLDPIAQLCHFFFFF